MTLTNDIILTVSVGVILGVLVSLLIFFWAAFKQKRIVKRMPANILDKIEKEKEETAEANELIRLRAEKEVYKNEEDTKEEANEEDSNEDSDGETASGHDESDDVEGEDGSNELPDLPPRTPTEIERSRELQRGRDAEVESPNTGSRKSKGRRKPSRFNPI